MPPLQDLLSSLGTDPLSGLSSEEARRRSRALGAYDIHIRDLLSFDAGLGPRDPRDPRAPPTTSTYARRGRRRAAGKQETGLSFFLRSGKEAAKAAFRSELFPCYCGMLLSFIGWVCEPYPSTQSVNFSSFSSFCIFIPFFTILQLSTASGRDFSPANPRDIRVEDASLHTATAQIMRMAGIPVFVSAGERAALASGPGGAAARDRDTLLLVYQKRVGSSDTATSCDPPDRGESLTVMDDGTLLFQSVNLEIPVQTAPSEWSTMLSGSDYIADHYKHTMAPSGRFSAPGISRSGAAPSTSASRFSSRYNLFSVNPLNCLGAAPQVSDHMRFKANVIGFLDSCFREALAPFQALQPDRYIVRRDGAFQVCRTNDIVEGDVVFLRVGQTAPCDLELFPHYPCLGASGIRAPGAPGASAGAKRLSAVLGGESAPPGLAAVAGARGALQLGHDLISADEPQAFQNTQAGAFFPAATNYSLLWDQPEVRAEFSRNVLCYLSFLDYLRSRDVNLYLNPGASESLDADKRETPRIHTTYSYSEFFAMQAEGGRRRSAGGLQSALRRHALSVAHNPDLTSETLLSLPSTVILQPSPEGPARNEFWVLAPTPSRRGAGVVEDLDNSSPKDPLAMESGLALSSRTGGLRSLGGRTPQSHTLGGSSLADGRGGEVQCSLGSLQASRGGPPPAAFGSMAPEGENAILPPGMARHLPGATAAEEPLLPGGSAAGASGGLGSLLQADKPSKPSKVRPRRANTGYGRSRGKSAGDTATDLQSGRCSGDCAGEQVGENAGGRAGGRDRASSPSQRRSAKMKKKVGNSPSRLLCGYTICSIANSVPIYYTGISVPSLFSSFLASCNRELATSQESAEFTRICMDYLSSHYVVSLAGSPGSSNDSLRLRLCTGVLGVAARTQTEVQILRQFSKRGERMISESHSRGDSRKASRAEDLPRTKKSESWLAKRRQHARKSKKRPQSVRGRGKNAASAQEEASLDSHAAVSEATIPATFFTHLSTLQPILKLVIPLSLVSSLIMIFAPHLPGIVWLPGGLDDFLSLWRVPPGDTSALFLRGFIPALTASLTFALACIVFTQKMTTILRPLLRSSAKYTRELARKMVFLPTLGSLEALGFTNTIVISEDILTSDKSNLKTLSVGSVSPMHYDVAEVKRLTSVFGNRAMNPYVQLRSISSKNVPARYLYLLRFVMASSLTTEELRFLLRKNGDLKNVYAGDYAFQTREGEASEISQPQPQAQTPGRGVTPALSAEPVATGYVFGQGSRSSGAGRVEDQPDPVRGELGPAERSRSAGKSGSSDIGRLADGDLLSGGIGVDYGVQSRRNSELDRNQARAVPKSAPAALVAGEPHPSAGHGQFSRTQAGRRSPHLDFPAGPLGPTAPAVRAGRSSRRGGHVGHAGHVSQDDQSGQGAGVLSHNIPGASPGSQRPALTSSQAASLSCFPLHEGLNFHPILTPSCVQEARYGIRQFNPLITGPDVLAFQAKLPGGNYLVVIRTPSIVTLSSYLGYVLTTSSPRLFLSPSRARLAAERWTDALGGQIAPIVEGVGAEEAAPAYLQSEYPDIQSRPSQGYLGDFEGTDFFEDARAAAELEELYALLPPKEREDREDWDPGLSGISASSVPPDQASSQPPGFQTDRGIPRPSRTRGSKRTFSEAQDSLPYRRITDADIRQLLATEKRLRETCTDIVHYAVCPGEESNYFSDSRGWSSAAESRFGVGDSGRRDAGYFRAEAPSRGSDAFVVPANLEVAHMRKGVEVGTDETPLDARLSESAISGASRASGASGVSGSIGSIHDHPGLSSSDEASSGEHHVVDIRALRIPTTRHQGRSPIEDDQGRSTNSMVDSVTSEVSNAGNTAKAYKAATTTSAGKTGKAAAASAVGGALAPLTKAGATPNGPLARPSMAVAAPTPGTFGTPAAALQTADKIRHRGSASGRLAASMAGAQTSFGGVSRASRPHQARERPVLYQHRENYGMLPGFFGQKEDYRAFWEAMRAKKLVYIGSASFSAEFGGGAADFVDRFRSPELGMDLVITTKRSEEEIGPLAQKLRLKLLNQRRSQPGLGAPENRTMTPPLARQQPKKDISARKAAKAPGRASPGNAGEGREESPAPATVAIRAPLASSTPAAPRAASSISSAALAGRNSVQKRDAQPAGASGTRMRRSISALLPSGVRRRRSPLPENPGPKRGPSVRPKRSSASTKGYVSTIITSNLGTLTSLVLSRSRKTKTMLLVDRAVEIVQRRKRRQSLWYRITRYLRRSWRSSRRLAAARAQKRTKAAKQKSLPLWIKNNQSGAYGPALDLPEFNPGRQSQDLTQELGMEGMQEASSLTESSLFGATSSTSSVSSTGRARSRNSSGRFFVRGGLGARGKSGQYAAEARPLLGPLLGSPKRSRTAPRAPASVSSRRDSHSTLQTGLSSGGHGTTSSDMAGDLVVPGSGAPRAAPSSSPSSGREACPASIAAMPRAIANSTSHPLILPPRGPGDSRQKDKKRYVQAGHAGMGSQPADIGDLPHVFIVPCSTSSAVASVLSTSGCHVTLVERAGAKNAHGVRATDIVRANSGETSRSPDLLIVGFDQGPLSAESEKSRKDPPGFVAPSASALSFQVSEGFPQSGPRSSPAGFRKQARVVHDRALDLSFTLRKMDVDFLRRQTGKRISVGFVLGRYGLSRMVDACQEVPFYFRTLSPVFLGTIRSRLLIGLLPVFYLISVLFMGSIAVLAFGDSQEVASRPKKPFYFPPCAVGLLLFVTLLFVEFLLPAIIWTKPYRGQGALEKGLATLRAWRQRRAAQKAQKALLARQKPPKPVTRRRRVLARRVQHRPLGNPSSRKGGRTGFSIQKKIAHGKAWKAWKAHEASTDDDGTALLGHQLAQQNGAASQSPQSAQPERKTQELPPIYIGSRAASLYEFNRALPKKTSPQGLVLTSMCFAFATIGVLLPAVEFWYFPSSSGLEFLQNDYIDFSPLRLSPFIMLLLVSVFTGLVSAALLVATRIPLGSLWGGIESLGQRVRKICLFICLQVIAVLVCFIAPTTFSSVSIFLLGFDVREIEADFWIAMMESACIAVVVDVVVILEQIL